MFRTVAPIVAVMAIVSGSALAQQKQVRQARAGESCQASYYGCGNWCDDNRKTSIENKGCKSECAYYRGVCEKTGVWTTALGKVEIRGLPPK